MRIIAPVVALLSLLSAPAARAATPTTFNPGSLIIPMDVDYQDAGMLKAFGLLDKLLRAGITVNWCIKTPKVVVDAANGRFESDFTAAARDVQSGATISDSVNGVATGTHAYRGGPFVIDAALATAALPIVKAWQGANVTAVHNATAPFSAPVSKTLTAAPRIAVLGDGNQAIAFSYLNAAGIPDETGIAWNNNSPDLLTPLQVAGPSAVNAQDGALFRPSGQPAFCEIMTMHWNVTSTDIPAVTAEFKSFLQFPVHLNAECQAVNAVEGAPPIGGNQKFVAPQGFVWPAPAQPQAVQYSNSSLPFAQMDGPFGTIGGSEPAYALPQGSAYYDSGIVMVRAAGQPIGVQDVWMTGYAYGGCPIGLECPGNFKGSRGKVSYLGGHQYNVATPMTKSPQTQGTRLFLNSLYEAGCVDGEGQPVIALTKSGPQSTSDALVTYTINYSNTGPGPAIGMTLSDTLSANVAFVSASNGGVFANGVVTWSIGDLASGAAGMVTLTVKLPAYGTYSNQASSRFKVGLNQVQVQSNTITTVYAAPVDMAMTADLANPPDMAVAIADMAQVADMAACGAPCPPPATNCQMSVCDPQNGCGFIAANEGMPCNGGNACVTSTTCLKGSCQGGAQRACPRLACTLASCDPMKGCLMMPAQAGTDPFMDCAGGACAATCDGMSGCTLCPPLSDGGMMMSDAGMTMSDGAAPADASVSMDDLGMAAAPDLTMMSMMPTDAQPFTDAAMPVDAAIMSPNGDAQAASDASAKPDASMLTDAATSVVDLASIDMAAGHDLATTSASDGPLSDLAGPMNDGGNANGGGATPGGCGCVAGGAAPRSTSPAVAVALIIGLALVRRRRRSL